MDNSLLGINSEAGYTLGLRSLFLRGAREHPPGGRIHCGRYSLSSRISSKQLGRK